MSRKKSAAQLDREIAEAIFSPHPRATAYEREKLAALRARFPIGAQVKIKAGPPAEYVGTVGEVTGYDLGYDEDEPLIHVRYHAPIEFGRGIEERTGKWHADEIAPTTGSRHAAKKGGWSVVVEEGYVKVKRDGETIAGGIDTGGKRLTGIEFTRPEYQRSNPTRQKAMKVLQAKGYR